MKAQVSFLHSPDVPDLDTYVPDDPKDVGLFFQIFVEVAGEPGEETFGLMVCTPAWLERHLSESGSHLIGRHHLFVSEWDLPLITNIISDVVASAEGDDWGAIAEKIGRFAHWEFEDYEEWGQSPTPGD